MLSKARGGSKSASNRVTRGVARQAANLSYSDEDDEDEDEEGGGSGAAGDGSGGGGGGSSGFALSLDDMLQQDDEMWAQRDAEAEGLFSL